MVVVLTNAERIHQYLVHAVGQLFPENAPALRLWRPGEIQPTEPPDLVILDDPFGTPGALALLENRKESTWALVRLRDARSALDNLDAYWRMIDYFPDRHLVILVDASQLLHAASGIRLGGPWERIAQGLVHEIAEFPNMHYASHFVVSIGDAGALSFSRLITDFMRDAVKPWHRRLYYYPRRSPLLLDANGTVASGHLFLAGLALKWLRSPALEDIEDGVCLGLEAAHSWQQRRDDPIAADRAVENLLEHAPAVAPVERTSPPFVVSLPEWWEADELRDNWAILQWRYKSDQDAARLALDILAKGADQALSDVPALRIDLLLTADKSEIDTLTSLQSRIARYLLTPAQHRPLNIGVFGSPGSGKSFAVESIVTTAARELRGAGVSLPIIKFNLTLFKNESDLADAFRQILASQSTGAVPVVFWDEFDRQFEGRDLGWLESFLVPTWDGKFMDGLELRTFGKVIFVFAGGTAHTYREFADYVARQPAGTKVADFLTRFSCKLDLPSLNYGENDEAFSNFALIRRALVLRSVIERFAPQLLHDGDELQIDPGVAWAFLRVNHFKFGARSIETLVNSSNLGGTYFGKSELPGNDILEMHLEVGEFRRLLNQRPDIATDDFLMATFRGWPIKPSDPDYLRYRRQTALPIGGAG